MRQEIFWIAFFGAALVVFGYLIFFAAPHLTDREMAAVRSRCEAWISSEFAGGREAKVNAHWTKNQRHVFEVYARSDRRAGYDVILCVYDHEAKRVMKPSVFDAPNWR